MGKLKKELDDYLMTGNLFLTVIFELSKLVLIYSKILWLLHSHFSMARSQSAEHSIYKGECETITAL